MNRLPGIIILVAAIIAAGQTGLSAQGRIKAAGAEFAFTGIGVSLQKYTSPMTSFHNISLEMDLEDVLDGESRVPGIRMSYVIDFIFAATQTRTFTLRWFAGPGFTAGYVRDVHRGPGIMAGICGNAGAEFSFSVPVCISISFMPSLATHISYSDGMPVMNLYRCGIMLHTLSPRIGIRYEF